MFVEEETEEKEGMEGAVDGALKMVKHVAPEMQINRRL